MIRIFKSSNVFRASCALVAMMAGPGFATAKPECAASPSTMLVPLLKPYETTPDCATLVGTWKVAVQPNGGPGFTAYNVFFVDGNSTEFDNSGSPAGQTIAVGPWKRTGTLKYSFVETNQLFDGMGNFAGTLTVRATINLDGSGDQFTSTFQFTVLDPTGAAVAQGTGAATATRVVD